MSIARLERVAATLVSVPLSRPYVRSVGALEAFETILVEVADESGRTGLGEATIPAGGYTHEILPECWRSRAS
jgi:L-alanine-DL-glutamate epimerase-like enolase superfamily enzyme